MAKAGSNNGYRGGPLPAHCPPSDAKDATDGIYLRLVVGNPCTLDDFRSGHAEGRRKPKSCDDCTWMASVWLDSTAPERLADLAKLPNLSDRKFVVHVAVDSTCGKVKPHKKDKEHLSFWMRESFEPHKAVTKIVAL